jgi:hypothetical protein
MGRRPAPAPLTCTSSRLRLPHSGCGVAAGGAAHPEPCAPGGARRVRGREQLGQRREQRLCGRRDSIAGARRQQYRRCVLHRLHAGGRMQAQGLPCLHAQRCPSPDSHAAMRTDTVRSRPARHRPGTAVGAQRQGDAGSAPGPHTGRRRAPPRRPERPARASARPPPPPGQSAAGTGPRAARRRRKRALPRPAHATDDAAMAAR